MSNDSLDRWLCVIEEHIRAIEDEQARRYRMDSIPEFVAVGDDTPIRWQGTTTGRTISRDPRFENFENFGGEVFLGSWGQVHYDPPSPLASIKANNKAAVLFKNVAGVEAYNLLNDKQPLPLTGSLGTAYKLHNTAVYCVTRVKDNAKLCAVVPNVPLWDHLLGIKMMIEQDEPAFLKVANIQTINIRHTAWEAQRYNLNRFISRHG